jgi:hypothetical protein
VNDTETARRWRPWGAAPGGAPTLLWWYLTRPACYWSGCQPYQIGTANSTADEDVAWSTPRCRICGKLVRPGVGSVEWDQEP